ncbi:MAG: DUF1849 family protein [Pseudomonadota bacterium]
MSLLRTAALAACAGTIVAAAPASAGDLVPHRAVYDIGLERVTGSNAVAAASGSLVMDWRDVCDGWDSDLDLRVQLFDSEEEEMRFGVTLSSWEAKDGNRYRFLARERATFLAPTDYEGTASIRGDGSGTARYREPEEETLALPEGTLFPIAHTLAVLQAAEAGEVFFATPIFDGSQESEKAVTFASATIFGPLRDDTVTLPRLAELDFYNVTLAFFEAGDEEGLPTHEVSVRLYENGVIDRQLFDYGDFVLSADITEISYHGDPDC